jgi:hypothetical protein
MSSQITPAEWRHYNARGHDLLREHERFMTRVEGVLMKQVIKAKSAAMSAALFMIQLKAN